MRHSDIRRLTVMALLVAVLAVCSQLAVPVGSVPVTAQTLAVLLIALLLPPKYAALTVLVWVLAGALGLPFFANFKSGFGVLLGPTGGYIYGFIISAWLVSWLAGQQGGKFSLLRSVLACTVGIVLSYLWGAVQLMLLLDLDSYAAAFLLGGVPYIFFEPVKIAAAVLVARLMWRRGLKRF